MAANKLIELDPGMDEQGSECKKQRSKNEKARVEMERLRTMIRITNAALKQARVAKDEELRRSGNPTKAVAHKLDQSRSRTVPFTNSNPKFDKDPHFPLKSGALPSNLNAGHMSPGPGAYHTDSYSDSWTFGDEHKTKYGPTFASAPGVVSGVRCFPGV